MSKKTTVSGILLVLLVLATTPLLGTDNVSFLKWWLMTLVLGIGFYPAAAALFPRFHDRGWMFSKVLGIVVSGFAVFALGSFVYRTGLPDHSRRTDPGFLDFRMF